SSGSGGWHTPAYGIGVKNATKITFDDVAIEYPTENGEMYRATFGVLVEGRYNKRSFEPNPIPQRATVSWRTPDGKLHKRDVVVADRVPDIRSFKGTVWFKISAEDVTVVPMT